jgi:hypothetical protein
MARRAIMLSRSPVLTLASGPTNGAASAGRALARVPESEADWLSAAPGARGPADAVESGESADRAAPVPGALRHAQTRQIAKREPSRYLVMPSRFQAASAGAM